MRMLVRIVGSLLALLVVQQVLAQQPGRLPQEPKGVAQLPPRPATVEGEPSRRDQSKSGQPRLTPEERRKLRRDINEAGRDIYRRDGLPPSPRP